MLHAVQIFMLSIVETNCVVLSVGLSLKGVILLFVVIGFLIYVSF